MLVAIFEVGRIQSRIISLFFINRDFNEDDGDDGENLEFREASGWWISASVIQESIIVVGTFELGNTPALVKAHKRQNQTEFFSRFMYLFSLGYELEEKNCIGYCCSHSRFSNWANECKPCKEVYKSRCGYSYTLFLSYI